jgi:hypothetical protein
MGIFCDEESCLVGMPETDKAKLIRRIRRFLGEPVMGVELEDEQVEEAICMAIEEYSTFINNWVINNRLGEMLGLPSEYDFTLKYVSNSLYFEKSFATSYGEQVGLGADSVRESKMGSIVLTAGTQDYTIPQDREVNEVLWFTPSFVNLFGLDPFANTNIAFTEFGASFAGHTLYHVMPVFDTILTAQAAELRNRVRGSEYSYILKPGPNGTKRLRLLPIPYPTNPSSGANMGIGGGFGTPGTVFYYYYDKANYYGNPLYSGNTANPNFSGYSGSLSGNQGNGLVSSPADVQLNFITWNQLNSVAQRWVKRYALALCKEILGLGIRGKFNGALPIPGAELTLNKDDLISTGREDQTKLIDELTNQLAELSYEKILEKRAMMQESINKTLGFGPMGISTF